MSVQSGTALLSGEVSEGASLDVNSRSRSLVDNCGQSSFACYSCPQKLGSLLSRLLWNGVA